MAMSHPRINMVLAIAAVVLAGFGCVSFFKALNWPFEIREKDWGVVHFFDGRVRMFWVQSPESPIVVEAYEFGPDFKARTIYDEEPPLPPDTAGPEPPRLGRPMRIRIGSRRTVPDFGGRFAWDPWIMDTASPPIQYYYFRLPVWLPVGLLLLWPVRAVVRGPWMQRRRKRRNRCVQCGYRLKGLPEPRCPECGTAIDLLAPL